MSKINFDRNFALSRETIHCNKFDSVFEANILSSLRELIVQFSNS